MKNAFSSYRLMLILFLFVLSFTGCLRTDIDLNIVEIDTISPDEDKDKNSSGESRIKFVTYLNNENVTRADEGYKPIATGRYITVYIYDLNGDSYYIQGVDNFINYESYAPGRIKLMPGNTSLILPSGSYYLYAVGVNDTIESQVRDVLNNFTGGVAENLSNGIDYIGWQYGDEGLISVNQDTSINMVLDHLCAQLVLFVDTAAVAGKNINNNVVIESVTITPPDSTQSEWYMMGNQIFQISGPGSTTANMNISGMYAYYVVWRPYDMGITEYTITVIFEPDLK